ncbi:hypothetical protein F7725_021220 [Dissostichus mawsoni]|uniref:Uncharacterized protein n=1 Tax=Dissostichus mawsoni TaxID=36200 RepID=A0A7J5YFF0_DISMA|nr:hypothetical protein F7725_021220 [Dissostichus mawsoni]
MIGGRHVSSVCENSTSEPTPLLSTYQKRDQQDLPAVQYIQDQPIYTGRADDTLTKEVPSVHETPEYGELSTAEPSPGPAGDQAQKETLFLAEGESDNLGVSGGPKNDGKPDSSSNTRMVLQGEKPHYGQHSHVTFEPSQVSGHRVTETSEDHRAGAGAPSPWSSCQNAESNPVDPCRRSPASDRTTSPLLRANGLRLTPDVQPDGKTFPSFASLRPGKRPPRPPLSFRPSLRNRSPSPVGSPPPSSVRSPPCSSPFRHLLRPLKTPPLSPELLPVSRCDLPLLLLLLHPPLLSLPLLQGGLHPYEPLLLPPLHLLLLYVPPCSSPIASSSSSSSSISQSIAKNTLQQMNTANQTPASTSSLPSSHLRRRSPSPKQQGSGMPAYAQLGRVPTSKGSPILTLVLFPSPSFMQSPPPSLSQRSPSPSMTSNHPQPPLPRPSFLHSKTDSSLNSNNNNNNNVSLSGLKTTISNTAVTRGVSNGVWSASPQKAPLANGSANAAVIPRTPDPHWSASPQKAPLANGSANAAVIPRTPDPHWSASPPKAPLTSSSANAVVIPRTPDPHWSASPQKAQLVNGSANAAEIPTSPDPHWSGSHNRVARPFSASEPSSRVQSPSQIPSSFTRICSPPPQHNYSSRMANKPPHPRLPRNCSASSCLSPRILSPPPIGVSLNVWANDVAAPQPRNLRYTPSSPSPSYTSSLSSPTTGNASYPTSSFPVMRSSRASSPSAPPGNSQTVRRSFSSNLADRPPSPSQSNPGVQRRSWADGSRRSFAFSGSNRGSFEQHESCPTSPRSGWSSYGSSPSCLSPRAGIHSPLSPSGLSPGKGTQHFTSVPWPDVRELSSKYNIADVLDESTSSTIIATSPSSLSEWGDPELDEGSCRSQLICAYVARPSCEQNTLSSPGVTSPVPYQNHNYQSQTPPIPSIPLSASPSPLPFAHSSPTKNQKTSYATTVNLQIAGSGRITSFSTAQVSLTQTLQGGALPGGQVEGMSRRVSINGLSHLPSPLPQNCNRQ